MFQLPGDTQFQLFDPDFTEFEATITPEVVNQADDPAPEIVAEAIDSLEELAQLLDQDDQDLHHFADSDADTPSRANVKMAS